MAPKTLGDRIAQARREKAVREHRDVTAAEVAKAVGVTNTSMSEWESDKKVPREEALSKLASFLGVTPAYLRYGVTEPAVLDLSRAKPLSEAQLDRADAITARAAKSAPKAKTSRKKGGAA